MPDTLLFLLVVVPFVAALGCLLLRQEQLRSLIVIGTGGLLTLCALMLMASTPFSAAPKSILGLSVSWLIQAADFILLGVIGYYGYKYRNLLIQGLAVLQFVLLTCFEGFMVKHGPEYATFYGDTLSLVMVLVICIVGSLICIHAIPYMKEHEHHLHLEVTKQPRFFAIMILFLGAMNGLVLTNDLSFFYFFFELTTLCSFLLIGHDQTEIAEQNAVRALWMNSLGGAALLIGIMWIYSKTGSLDMQALVTGGPKAALLLPLALMCFAGFTKAAQAPFQSWLLGAMVAPTPTSALLHSSTMVKAGVYLVIRLAPAYAGTFLSLGVALAGAFTFLAMAALAMGQSNGKKILAYSTVSNLGLIMACAGINTKAAIIAAILLIIFHAVTKALLFLCVGTIEQRIGSRDIEDMRGLLAQMPWTATVIVAGILTMILPPFGMLLGKWVAIESSAQQIFVITMLALGSALTVAYWARWAGQVMSVNYLGAREPELQPTLTRGPLAALLGGAVVLSVLWPFLYNRIGGDGPGLANPAGVAVMGFMVLVIGGGFVWAVNAMRDARKARMTKPYLCGAPENVEGTYVGPINQNMPVTLGNAYFTSLATEERLTCWVNMGACLMLVLMIGGAL